MTMEEIIKVKNPKAKNQKPNKSQNINHKSQSPGVFLICSYFLIYLELGTCNL